jgi:predicted unusual protein kinase regulating ubiquinone biosynthesis (AarF/ABC1/UbiB family)
MYSTYASYLMYMTGGKKMGIMELRKALGQRIEAAFFHNEATFIEHGKKGEVRAALVPPAWVEELEELREFKARAAEVSPPQD